MIDEALGDISLFQREFLLVQYLRTEMVKSEYGRKTHWMWIALKSLCVMKRNMNTVFGICIMF
ncbi:Hypothetical protein PHPALM_14699 [Phytophthora palmivora]|uniref:Uncharacterized protein n=1 Tax=Phytophthora palmivora TaxID=4796 RepID=A0A2P4XUA0_9STRA|nr:Hypothetical protein PHPALM_14699 [Phytophthora palmivora]